MKWDEMVLRKKELNNITDHFITVETPKQYLKMAAIPSETNHSKSLCVGRW
jgi:hypothetical protein